MVKSISTNTEEHALNIRRNYGEEKTTFKLNLIFNELIIAIANSSRCISSILPSKIYYGTIIYRYGRILSYEQCEPFTTIFILFFF